MLVLTPSNRVSIEEINQHGYFDDSIYEAVMRGDYGREKKRKIAFRLIITMYYYYIYDRDDDY